MTDVTLSMKSLRLLLLWARSNANNIALTVALAAIAAGCYLERPSLALLIPGGIVFTCLAYTGLRGD